MGGVRLALFAPKIEERIPHSVTLVAEDLFVLSVFELSIPRTFISYNSLSEPLISPKLLGHELIKPC